MKTLSKLNKKILNNHSNWLVGLTILLLLTALSVSGYSMTAKQLVAKLDKLENVKTSESFTGMAIYPDMNDNKNYRIIKMKSYSKGKNSSFNRYLYPNNVKGMKMLSRGDNVWMFFPSTGRKRKIASYNKKNSPEGVGGDFSYQDMQNENYVTNYRARIIKENNSAWTLQLTPRKTNVYKKLVLTVQKGSFKTTKILYYDKNGFLKTCFITGYKKLKGKYLMPTTMTMVNYRKKSKTVIKIVRMKVDIPVANKYFDANRLESN